MGVFGHNKKFPTPIFKKLDTAGAALTGCGISNLLNNNLNLSKQNNQLFLGGGG
jgi:hypothetical protein